MLAEYKKKSNIGIAIAIIVWILGGILVGFLGELLTEEDAAAVTGLSAIPFIYGCWYYAKGKGYHGAWGLLGILFVFGLLILVFFPDKYKAINTQDQVDKEK